MARREGKTKIVIPFAVARMIAKDDITAGDGVKHDMLPGKGELATTTTCQVFELLRACGLPVAYLYQDSPHSFVSRLCRMLPLEIVVRREAHGSYLKRHPEVALGQRFAVPLVEFYLKTKDKTYGKYRLVCDDPLMKLVGDHIELYDPKEVSAQAKPFLTLHRALVCHGADYDALASLAVKAFLALETAWALLAHHLCDMKIECGIAKDEQRKPQIYIADVIDNDSWRVTNPVGNYVDKQLYRDGGSLKAVFATYQVVAALTERFLRPDTREVAQAAANHPSVSYARGF